MPLPTNPPAQAPRCIPLLALLPPLLVLGTAGRADADADAPRAASLRFPGLAPDGLRTELAAEAMVATADRTVVGALVEGQYVAAQGVGGYVRMGHAVTESYRGLSNLELGALYRLDRGRLALAVRGGVVVPAGSDDNALFAPLIAAALRRPSDLTLGGVEALAARASLAPTYRHGALVVRGDLGLDLVEDTDVGLALVIDDDQDPELLYHLDVAAAVRRARFAASVQVSTVGSAERDTSDRFHVVALGAHYDLDAAQLSATLCWPYASGNHVPLDALPVVAVGVSAPL